MFWHLEKNSSVFKFSWYISDKNIQVECDTLKFKILLCSSFRLHNSFVFTGHGYVLLLTRDDSHNLVPSLRMGDGRWEKRMFRR